MEKERTILIIDDETDFSGALKYQIEAKRPFKVFTAANGVEGLTLLKELKPDLIILDMNMPKMGGIELYKNICDEKSKVLYPVLVLTARANLESLFKELDVDGFMTKPIEFDALLKEIDAIILRRTGQLEAKRMVEDAARPLKVVIVDDNKASSDKIVTAFVNNDYSVTVARTGLSAVVKVLNEPPDLIVMKLTLPDIPGELICSKLKKMPKTAHVPIIVFIPDTITADSVVVSRLCEDLKFGKIVETDDPQTLIKEAGSMLKK